MWKKEESMGFQHIFAYRLCLIYLCGDRVRAPVFQCHLKEIGTFYNNLQFLQNQRHRDTNLHNFPQGFETSEDRTACVLKVISIGCKLALLQHCKNILICSVFHLNYECWANVQFYTGWIDSVHSPDKSIKYYCSQTVPWNTLLEGRFMGIMLLKAISWIMLLYKRTSLKMCIDACIG